MTRLIIFLVSAILLLASGASAKQLILNMCYDSSKKNFSEMKMINLSYTIDLEKKIIIQRMDQVDSSKSSTNKFNIISNKNNVVNAENQLKKIQEVNLIVYLNERKIEISIPLFETTPPHKKVNVKTLYICQ
jgi:hypothetical protein